MHVLDLHNRSLSHVASQIDVNMLVHDKVMVYIPKNLDRSMNGVAAENDSVVPAQSVDIVFIPKLSNRSISCVVSEMIVVISEQDKNVVYVPKSLHRSNASDTNENVSLFHALVADHEDIPKVVDISQSDITTKTSRHMEQSQKSESQRLATAAAALIGRLLCSIAV